MRKNKKKSFKQPAPSTLKKLSERWPKGIKQLCADLEQKGFHPEAALAIEDASLLSFEIEKFSLREWKELKFPTSITNLESKMEAFSFFSSLKNIPEEIGRFGLVFLDKKFQGRWPMPGQIFLKTENVEAAFDYILKELWVPEWTFAARSGASKTAIYKNVKIAKSALVEPHVLIGPMTEISDLVVIESGTRIGANVKIGKGTRIGANSRIADHTTIGENCMLHSHVAIGGQGFGTVKYPGDDVSVQRIHVGNVVIGDNVRMGSHVSVDRGVLTSTRVMAHSVIDNIVQIAHNCEVGEGALICSFVGLSGSTVLGKNVTIAGMVGTKGHVSIGDNVVIAAQSGVLNDIASGSQVKGYPPKPILQALKIQALVDRLPEFYDRLKKVEVK